MEGYDQKGSERDLSEERSTRKWRQGELLTSTVNKSGHAALYHLGICKKRTYKYI